MSIRYKVVQSQLKDSVSSPRISATPRPSRANARAMTIAGCGPCGRPHPGWEIGYPEMADGHEGRAVQKHRNVHEEHTSALSER